MSRAVVVLFAVGCSFAGSVADGPSHGNIQERAALIRPTADELRWQRIPWLTNLADGQKLAQQERRPLFLWVTGDDPLERC